MALVPYRQDDRLMGVSVASGTGSGIIPASVSVDTSGNVGTVVAGDVAANVTDTGNPVKIGGVVVGGLPSYSASFRGNLAISTAGQVLVAPYNTLAGADGLNNARIGQAFGLDGLALFPMSMNFTFNGTTWDRTRGDVNGTVIQPALSTAFWNFASATGGIVNTTTAVTIKAAGGAGVRNYISAVQVSHDALGGATELAIRDGAAGTVLWRGKLQTTATEGGGTIKFNPPLRGTANTLTEVVTLTAVTGGVFVNAQGYTGV